MRVLVACEFSGTVRDAFAERGHDAWSCDIVPARNGGKHYRTDVLNIINDGWDLIVAHPPCTYLSKVQAIHYDAVKWPTKTAQRIKRRDAAIMFFLAIQQAECERIAIENPIPMKIVTDSVGMYDQIVQPWMFGDPFSKAVCLWLKGLPTLEPTEVVEKGEMVRTKNGTNAKWYHNIQPGENRGRQRSITFPGLAEAMAEQWG